VSDRPRSIVVLSDACDPEAAEVAEIVRVAMVRSFSGSVVRARGYGRPAPDEAAAVAVAPPEGSAGSLSAFASGGRKLLLLGPLGPRAASIAGLPATAPADVTEAEASAPARRDTPFDVSPALWRWNVAGPSGAETPLPVRAFCRFDFAEEWNHLGHGRIPADPGPWSSWTTPTAGDAVEAARVEVDGTRRGIVAARLETETAAILWIGRRVGPVDGLDWTVVERFFSDHRHGELPCWPSFCDWPAGFDAGATFRLDCDEAVASARPLFDRYRERGVPVSLALRAGLELAGEDRRLVADVVASGGTLLSHSTRHLPDWGRDLAEARAEARGSRARLEALFPEAGPVRFAVSPFHRNPRHAVRAVAEAGYEALVTGSIANDPECLIGRAGTLPFSDPPLVSHSQQNMLHGDGYARQGESVRAWREAAESHRRAGALYGYLDHPFSERYSYGWTGETQRRSAHDSLLDAILAWERPWLPSLGQALGHLVRRARTELALDDAGRPRAAGPPGPTPFSVRLGGAWRAV